MKTASKSESGMFRCGSFTSSATGAMFIHPLYAHKTPTSATPKPLQLMPRALPGQVGLRCETFGG